MNAMDIRVRLRTFPIHSRDHVGRGAPGRSGGIGAVLLCLAWMMGGCSMLPEYSPAPIFKDRAERRFPMPSEMQPDADSTPVASRETLPSDLDHPFSLEERMSFGRPSGTPPRQAESSRVFSFRAQDMPLADALRLFSRVNTLNIIVEPGVEGVVTVDFQGFDLDKALAALLETQGYYWERDEELIVVRRLETRIFTLDYIRMERSGTGRNKAQVTSGSG